MSLSDFSLQDFYILDLNHDSLWTDINECVDNTASCSHLCVNMQQSFTCECHKGYKLQTDAKSCSGDQGLGSFNLQKRYI